MKFHYKPNEAIIIPDSQRNIAPTLWSWVLMGASRLGLRPRYIPLGTIVNGEHLIGRNIK